MTEVLERLENEINCKRVAEHLQGQVDTILDPILNTLTVKLKDAKDPDDHDTLKDIKEKISGLKQALNSVAIEGVLSNTDYIKIERGLVPLRGMTGVAEDYGTTAQALETIIAPFNDIFFVQPFGKPQNVR